MPRYEFLWRRRDVERPYGEGGWRSKTISAANDAEAAERMLDHCAAIGRPVEIDYEMARLDVPYNPDKHDLTFWNMERAGVQLYVN
jgi:hypothetical protein